MKAVVKTGLDFNKKYVDLCELTKEVWRRYFAGTEQEIREFEKMLVPDCVIIGTGEHEFYQDKETFVAELAQAMEQRQNIKFFLRKFWANENYISEDIRLVYGEADLTGEIADGRAKFDMDTHYSILYKFDGEKWSIIHLVQSIPSRDQMDGEYFPTALIGQIEQAWEHADKMTELAQTDGLTGLMNRSAFEGKLREYQDKKCMVAMLYVDLDNFKAVNDTFGHAAGDLVLKKTAELLRGTFRKEDSIARLGGDEFCVFLELKAMDHPELKRLVCEKMEHMIGKMPICVREGRREVWVTLSAGVCIHELGPRFTTDDVLEIADDAMYAVKKSGRNGVCIYMENDKTMQFRGNWSSNTGSYIQLDTRPL